MSATPRRRSTAWSYSDHQIQAVCQSCRQSITAHTDAFEAEIDLLCAKPANHESGIDVLLKVCVPLTLRRG
jgi:hypothetical protein